MAPGPRRLRLSPAHALARRNRLLGLLLAGMALFGLITVVSLALGLHFVEAHHLPANF